jgi:hypothetical protein
MPACAVASRTPSIDGISGTWVGARGETVVLMVRPVPINSMDVPT